MDSAKLTPTVEMFERQLATILGQLAELEGQRDRLRDRAETYRRAIETIQAVIDVESGVGGGMRAAGHANSAGHLDLVVAPRTSGERLLTVLRSEPDRLWRLPELLERMRQRGWINPDVRHQLETLRSAANALAHSNPHVQRIPPSLYRYHPPSPPIPSGSADEGEGGDPAIAMKSGTLGR